MSHHHQTAGETDPVSGAGDGPLVGQVLGDLLEPPANEPVERLQNEQRLTETVDHLPDRISAGEVSQLVGEETGLVLDGEISHSLGATDLGLSDTGGKWHGDRL